MAEEAGRETAHDRYFGERLTLLHNDLREFREEMRSGLAQRVTHAELTALHQLLNTKLENLSTRSAERESNLRGEIAKQEQEINDIEQKVEEGEKKRGELQRYLIYSVVGGAGAVIGTNLVQGMWT